MPIQVTLPGVNIAIKGTTQGTSTKPDGSYTINNVPSMDESVLIFSFIGYQSLEIPVEGINTINVHLKHTALQMGMN